MKTTNQSSQREFGGFEEMIPLYDKPPDPWQRIRGIVMFGVACIASPCCTPLYVPLAVALLAGTPAAIWLSAHIGWVYAVFTLISGISFVLGFRWLGQRHASKDAATASRQFISPPVAEMKQLKEN